MKAKIDVFRKKEPLNHQWSKFETVNEEKEKYDVYFKNRFYSNDAYEEYDDLQLLDGNYIAYEEYEDKQGNMFSYWAEEYPDMVSFDEGSQQEILTQSEYPYIDLKSVSTTYQPGEPFYTKSYQSEHYKPLGTPKDAYTQWIQDQPKEIIPLSLRAINADLTNIGDYMSYIQTPVPSNPAQGNKLETNVLEMTDGQSTGYFNIKKNTTWGPKGSSNAYYYFNAVWREGVYANSFTLKNPVRISKTDYPITQTGFWTSIFNRFKDDAEVPYIADGSWTGPKLFDEDTCVYYYRGNTAWVADKVDKNESGFKNTFQRCEYFVREWNRINEYTIDGNVAVYGTTSLGNDCWVIIDDGIKHSSASTGSPRWIDEWGRQVEWVDAKRIRNYFDAGFDDYKQLKQAKFSPISPTGSLRQQRYNYNVVGLKTRLTWVSSANRYILETVEAPQLIRPPYEDGYYRIITNTDYLSFYQYEYRTTGNRKVHGKTYGNPKERTTYFVGRYVYDGGETNGWDLEDWTYQGYYVYIPFVFSNFQTTDFVYKLEGDLTSEIEIDDNYLTTPTVYYHEFMENPNGYNYVSVRGKPSRFKVMDTEKYNVPIDPKKPTGGQHSAFRFKQVGTIDINATYSTITTDNFIDRYVINELDKTEYGNLTNIVHNTNVNMEDYSIWEEWYIDDDLGYQHYITRDWNTYAVFNGNGIFYVGENASTHEPKLISLGLYFEPDPASMFGGEFRKLKEYDYGRYLYRYTASYPYTGAADYVYEGNIINWRTFITTDYNNWMIEEIPPYEFESSWDRWEPKIPAYYPELGMTLENAGTENQPRLEDYTYIYYLHANQVPAGRYYVWQKRYMMLDDYERYIADWSSNQFTEYDGDWTINRIDLDTLRYGYSHKTDKISNEPKVRYISKDSVRDMLLHWQDNLLWKPTSYKTVKQITNQHYEVSKWYYPSSEQYDWHVMGIATDQPFLDSNGDRIALSASASISTVLANYLYTYIPIYVELTTPIPARTCYITEYDLYMTNFKGRGLDDEQYLNYSNYGNYNVFVRNVEREPKFRYMRIEQFDSNFKNYLLIDEIIRLSKGTCVPLLHWPEMLFTDKHYNDVPLYEYIKGGPTAPYPTLGYYPPKRELFEDPIVEDYVCPTDVDALWRNPWTDVIEASILDPAFVDYIDNFVDILYQDDYDVFTQLLDSVNTRMTFNVDAFKTNLTSCWYTYHGDYFASNYKAIRQEHPELFPWYMMGDVWVELMCIGAGNISDPQLYDGLIPLFRVSELNDDIKFYRKCADTHTYYSTEKAGEILLPLGVDINNAMNLSSIETLDTPAFFDTNCFSYEYVGTVTYKKPGLVVDRKISDEDFNAYPKDGVAPDGYWYKYLGTNELLDFIWPEYSLRSVPDYNIDINSAEDLTIGDVAGASFRVQVQGTVKELIKYLGRKCILYYDFMNTGKYSNYGVFTISDVSFINHSVSQIVAYDNIKKFDKPVLDYITTLTYPMTAKELWHIMCNYCEMPYYQQDEFLNSDALIYGPFGDNNLTARQVVAYIAQIAGGYIVCDKQGYAVIRNLMPVRTSLYNNLKVYNDSSYITNYKNLPPLRTYQSEKDGANTFNNVFLKNQQKMQIMNEFPIDLMDTINYNSAGGINYITFRENINSILDLSDNPFIYNVEDQVKAQRIMDRIIDQFWLVYPVDRDKTGPNMDGTEISPAPYNGNIQTFEFDLDDLGVANIIELTNNRKYRIIVPTTISISSIGVDITGKGQSTYSQKVIGTELSRQVDVIRNAVKETRLLIPDALTTTLNELNEDVDSLEDWRTDTDALDTQQNNRLTAVETKNQQQDEEWSQFATLVGTDIGTIRRDYLTKSSASDTYLTKNNASSTYLTQSGASSTYATKSEVNDNNSITQGVNSVFVESGGSTLSLIADNEGFLTISFGGFNWKVKLETEDE